MATESPLIHDGSQTTLSTSNDFRNSAISGTTLPGPSGSGQFLLCYLSTVNARQVLLGTTVQFRPYGVMQNKPGPGQGADIGIFGVTKLVLGSTVALQSGSFLMASTISFGTVLAASTVVTPLGIAIESVAASSSGAVFTGFYFGALGFGASQLQ